MSKLVIVENDIAIGQCASHGPSPIPVTGKAISTCPTIQASGFGIIRDTNPIKFSCGHTGICKSSSTINISGLAPMLNGDLIVAGTGLITATIKTTNNKIVQSE